MKEHNLELELEEFCEFGSRTKILDREVKYYVNQFWTSQQRKCHSLHEVSYRACFKPQLPRFFIERFTSPGDVVYDPFMGRGTTLLESHLLGRSSYGCDINPISKMIISPRLGTVNQGFVSKKLKELRSLSSFESLDSNVREDLLVFFHESTLENILKLRDYFKIQDNLNLVDSWIRMVALNRLTGHSPGFFSVYTLPPNQAVSPNSQRVINDRYNQKPPFKDIFSLIAKKSRSLSRDKVSVDLSKNTRKVITGDSSDTPLIEDDSVDLIVTSPPFLDTVDYNQDNWLRAWFSNVELDIPTYKTLNEWKSFISRSFVEFRRVLKPEGYLAFEVGEVRSGRVDLDEHVLECGRGSGLEPQLVMVHAADFTKTSKCWGVDNMSKGTNTNRIVLFQKKS